MKVIFEEDGHTEAFTIERSYDLERYWCVKVMESSSTMIGMITHCYQEFLDRRGEASVKEARCRTCGEIKTVCCDTGYDDHGHHEHATCIDCCTCGGGWSVVDAKGD